MKILLPLLLCGSLWLCGSLAAGEDVDADTPKARLAAAVAALEKAGTSQERFYALNDAAKQYSLAGKTDEAKACAHELLRLAAGYPKDWNYGNAIQDANIVLGRIAMNEGRMGDAKQHLLAAGKSPGSPQMNTFGPNVSLAKDLLDKGERDAVIVYLTLCRGFWKMHQGTLDTWIQEIKDGKSPKFGANLVF